MTRPWHLLGTPTAGGILIVGDHASNHVPAGIELGIDPALMNDHIAVDIGVAEISAHMANMSGFSAFLGASSRLVADLNRDPDDPAAIPHQSDAVDIAGNVLDEAGMAARLNAWHHPYHNRLAEILAATPPALILSLHSFTPGLKSRPEELRPWHVGVLYNDDDRAARLAIPLLEAEGLIVGDQLPYSGKLLNATMNRHAEAHDRPYLGIEIRQDQISEPEGQAAWAERLSRICQKVALKIAE